jgi:hypothetical protein
MIRAAEVNIGRAVTVTGMMALGLNGGYEAYRYMGRCYDGQNWIFRVMENMLGG